MYVKMCLIQKRNVFGGHTNSMSLRTNIPSEVVEKKNDRILNIVNSVESQRHLYHNYLMLCAVQTKAMNWTAYFQLDSKLTNVSQFNAEFQIWVFIIMNLFLWFFLVVIAGFRGSQSHFASFDGLGQRAVEANLLHLIFVSFYVSVTYDFRLCFIFSFLVTLLCVPSTFRFTYILQWILCLLRQTTET